MHIHPRKAIVDFLVSQIQHSLYKEEKYNRAVYTDWFMAMYRVSGV